MATDIGGQTNDSLDGTLVLPAGNGRAAAGVNPMQQQGPAGLRTPQFFPLARDKVRCVGDKVTLWCNDKLAWGATDFSDKKGYLGLQAEGAAMEFRNLRVKEIGWYEIELTESARDDALFGSCQPTEMVFQWHGDTFDLPVDAVLLASSPLYPNQAFRWGDRAYAVQFHLEVSAGMAREWGEVPEYRNSLERTLGPGALERLIAELEREESAMVGMGRRLFERWLELPAPARLRAS